MKRTIALVILAGAFATAACDSLGRAMTSHTDVLARAAGHELTVEKAAGMVAPRTNIPAQADVVRAIATLWVDYILFATAASKDSTLSNVDLDPLLKPFLDQDAVVRLRDKVVKVDSITDEQLLAEFQTRQPGIQVRARHILLRLPQEATPAQLDSVTRLATSLRDRARGREDFAALAKSFSQDPGSATVGGDLGFFPRGGMVPQFDSAAFVMKVGEVSDIVQTMHGLHVIKVEERKQPTFDDVKVAFRDSLMMQRMAQAENKYFEDLIKPLQITVADGAVANAKELATKPDMELRGRAASRPLVRYEGGALTAGEFLVVLRGAGPNPAQFASAPDDQVKNMLEQLAKHEVLINKAKSEGLEATEQQRDSARAMLRNQLQQVAQMTGLSSIQPQSGETPMQAVERRVMAYLDALLNQEAQVIPLGALSFSLREQFKGEIFERSFQPTVAKIEELRGAAVTSPLETPRLPGQAPTPNTPPTTSGGN